MTRLPPQHLQPLRGTETRPPWRSFWMAGFEGADHVNGRGQALDLVRMSGHWDRLHEDHRRVRQAGFRCVRESVGWRLCEDGRGRIDLSRLRRVAQSARAQGLQVLWTLMHYGVPAGLSLHDDRLVERLAHFAQTVARALRSAAEGPTVYTPINEISYLAWAASQSQCNASALLGASMVAAGQSSAISGYDVKRRLARAALAAMRAIRAEDPVARFLHVEPVVHVVPPEALAQDAQAQHRAAEVSSWQWQAWDLLAGRLEPELGGGAEWLDWLGVNHYHSSQWELDTERRLAWHLGDARRRPLADLLDDTWQRYRRPLIVAETGHIGVGRGAWLNDIASQVRETRQRGVPVEGVCLYPAVDRPDWDRPQHWHRSGLWHVAAPHSAHPGARVAEPGVHEALAAWRAPRAGLVWPPVPPVLPALPVLMVLSDRPWAQWPPLETPALAALTRWWRIVYVQAPRRQAGAPRIEARSHGPALQVLQPWLGDEVPSAADLAQQLHAWCNQGGLRPCAVWPLAAASEAAAERPDEQTALPWAPVAAALAQRLAVPRLDWPRPLALPLRDFARAHNTAGIGWASEEVAQLVGTRNKRHRVACIAESLTPEARQWHHDIAACMPEAQVLLLGGASPALPLSHSPLLAPLLTSFDVLLHASPWQQGVHSDALRLHLLATGRPVLVSDDINHAAPWVWAAQQALRQPRAQHAARWRRTRQWLRRHDAPVVAARLNQALQAVLGLA